MIDLNTIGGRAVIGIPMIIMLFVLWRILWTYYNIKYEKEKLQ